MTTTLEASPSGLRTDDAWEAIARIAQRIPPLWDLENYVAVNPYLGFAGTPIARAAEIVSDGLAARTLPPIEHYRERWRAGAFSTRDVGRAAGTTGVDAERLTAILDGAQPPPARAARRAVTFAERHDHEHGTDWHGLLVRSAARWCAVHASAGGTHWPLARHPGGLYASWREAETADRSLEIAGLRGFRTWASRLPDTPVETVAAMLDRLRVDPADVDAYLYRLLSGLYGWACWFRRATWEQGANEPGAIADLLAIRIAADASAAGQEQDPRRVSAKFLSIWVDDETTRVALQDAVENGYARSLLGKLRGGSAPTSARPEVQAAFCIDVRSEPLRRHLEAQSPGIETRGFAGFFGVALEYASSARCPVLLKPSLRVRGWGSPSPQVGTLKRIQTAPAAAFSFVEVLGLAYGVGLATDACGAVRNDGVHERRAALDVTPHGTDYGAELEARVDLAVGILKNMGFRDTFARLVLLCGHEGRSENNPHAASLDCGACGGHGGALNARAAAAVLNDPQVRAALPGRGWNLPADTWFVPAVYDTSTDEVELLHFHHLPPSHGPDVAVLRRALEAASQATRVERAPALGLGVQPPGLLARLLGRRARDWSEVRPEWALARNAAFIAARRGRSRGVDLEGRAFLHEYDAEADPDLSVLTLILAAPMVVASWINLQYFASTVDNAVFGCGDKALHNRVGALGVVLGNGGDLRTGLPLQSVHGPDGRWRHEPLRLQVFVEAMPENLDRVLKAQPGVRDLVEYGWVRLFALDREQASARQRLADGRWETLDGPEA